MLIKSLKTHFPARVVEWLMSAIMFSWGYYVVTHPQLFTSPGTREVFSGLAKVAEFFGQPPVTIGIMAIIVGLVRAGALFVNGAVTKTPFIRLVTAFGSAYIWTTILLGFGMTEVANTGLAIYPWFVIADIVSAYRSGYDLVIAETTAKHARSIHAASRNAIGGDGHSERHYGTDPDRDLLATLP